MEYFGLEDVKIRIFGDAAIVQTRNPYRTKDGVTGESRYSDVKRNGCWQAISAQIRVFLPKPPNRYIPVVTQLIHVGPEALPVLQ